MKEREQETETERAGERERGGDDPSKREKCREKKSEKGMPFAFF